MNFQTEQNPEAKPTIGWSSTILPSKHILITLWKGLCFLDSELHMIRAIYLSKELQRFTDLRICMPTNEESLSFVIGGELVGTETKSNESSNTYEGSNKPGVTSQILKISLNIDNEPAKPFNVRLEFIDEHKKSLTIRNEIIEY